MKEKKSKLMKHNKTCKKKKINLQFDDYQYFICKDLPFELISNQSIQFFSTFLYFFRFFT